MDRLEREITTMKNRFEENECSLILFNARNNEVVRNQEQQEHRLSNLEESHEDLQKKVTMVQEDVVMIREYLNNAITRINDLHRWLDECSGKDLWCSEKMDSSDDDDDEFDLDDCSEKIELEIQQMKDKDSTNN